MNDVYLCIGLFLLSNYGWYILLIVIVLFIVWANIKPSVQKWLKKREERIEEQNFDPVKAEQFQDGMMKSREKMQRELEERAREHQETVEQVYKMIKILFVYSQLFTRSLSCRRFD